MNTLLFTCIVAAAMQLSLQQRVWPVMPSVPVALQPPVRFPPTSSLAFPEFCAFATINCHRYHSARDPEMCFLAATHCVSDFESSCPAKLGVCKKFSKICTEAVDLQFQDICNLQVTSCNSVHYMELPAPASLDTTQWCQTIMPMCMVNMGAADCRLENPNCAIFRVACNADVSTEAQRAAILCRHLPNPHNYVPGTMAMSSPTMLNYYDQFQCDRFNNPQQPPAAWTAWTPGPSGSPWTQWNAWNSGSPWTQWTAWTPASSGSPWTQWTAWAPAPSGSPWTQWNAWTGK